MIVAGLGVGPLPVHVTARDVADTVAYYVTRGGELKASSKQAVVLEAGAVDEEVEHAKQTQESVRELVKQREEQMREVFRAGQHALDLRADPLVPLIEVPLRRRTVLPEPEIDPHNYIPVISSPFRGIPPFPRHHLIIFPTSLARLNLNLLMLF